MDINMLIFRFLGEPPIQSAPSHKNGVADWIGSHGIFQISQFNECFVLNGINKHFGSLLSLQKFSFIEIIYK